jgi:putative peptidoglycan lipid II flippase
MGNPSNKISRNAGIVSSGIAISRIFGYLRDALIAYFLTDSLRDIFFLVFAIPNFARRFFGEGALSSAFIPIFSESYKKEGEGGAWKMASSTVNITFIVLVLLTFVGILISPLIIKFIAFGFPPQSQEIAVLNLRIMFPFMVFICLQAIFMATLNSMGHFFVPSFAPVFLNFSVICVALIFREKLSNYIVPLSWSVVVGGFLHMFVQLPVLAKRGFKYSFQIDWHSRAIRRMFKLMGPALLAVGVVQINLLIDKMFASTLPAGGVSALWYSNRLIQLPLALFGISVAQAAFPTLSSHAVDKEHTKMKRTLLYSFSLIGLVIIPASFALVFFGRPVINLLFQHGKFTSSSANSTYFALVFYTLGLVFFAGTRIVASTFHALKDMRTPLKIGVITVTINIILNAILIKTMQEGGIALATSLASLVNFILLLYFLRKHLGDVNIFSISPYILKIITASCIMSVFLWIGANYFYSTDLSVLVKMITVLLTVLAGVGSYFISCYFLNIPEVRAFKESKLWKSKTR